MGKIIRSLQIIIVLVLLLTAGAVNASEVTGSINGTVNAKTLISLTNSERQKDGLPALKENATLDKVAKLKAQDMVKNGYFAHNSPSGKTPWYWFKIAGYKYTSAGENLATLFDDSKSVVEGWMNSPLHRANILAEKYSIFWGLAFIRAKKRQPIFYWVMWVFRRLAHIYTHKC